MSELSIVRVKLAGVGKPSAPRKSTAVASLASFLNDGVKNFAPNNSGRHRKQPQRLGDPTVLRGSGSSVKTESTGPTVLGNPPSSRGSSPSNGLPNSGSEYNVDDLEELAREVAQGTNLLDIPRATDFSDVETEGDFEALNQLLIAEVVRESPVSAEQLAVFLMPIIDPYGGDDIINTHKEVVLRGFE
tara:strand:+ start:1716 stop:2279 length:564 start_codon:yes stop_codon:yes gene_type:complete